MEADGINARGEIVGLGCTDLELHFSSQVEEIFHPRNRLFEKERLSRARHRFFNLGTAIDRVIMALAEPVQMADREIHRSEKRFRHLIVRRIVGNWQKIGNDLGKRRSSRLDLGHSIVMRVHAPNQRFVEMIVEMGI